MLSIPIRFQVLAALRCLLSRKRRQGKYIFYAAVFEYLVGVNRLFRKDTSERKILLIMFSTTQVGMTFPVLRPIHASDIFMLWGLTLWQ
jgi:hypothetical protein